MSALTEILPAKGRAIAYSIYGFLGVGLGSIPVYCAATDAITPTWSLGALAVYAFVGAPLFGATAASNTPSE
ncbi:hypothetical protein ACIRON_02635 [Nocardioides sp. NPDC101246]|uniref:hypothetical protein n=1 Tax=Nocardioides sp. NPDC101246 TaxID=3364336 RepID=UPI0038175AB6